MHATDETDATATGAAGVDVEGGLDEYAPMIREIECKEIGSRSSVWAVDTATPACERRRGRLSYGGIALYMYKMITAPTPPQCP